MKSYHEKPSRTQLEIVNNSMWSCEVMLFEFSQLQEKMNCELQSHDLLII